VCCCGGVRGGGHAFVTTCPLPCGVCCAQGTGDLDQINTIFKLLGTPSEQSWPKFGSLRAVQTAVLPFVENHTISLGPDGTLVKLPKSTLRKKFPAEGYTPAAAQLSEHRTTALSDAGFELLNAFLTCDPEQRATAATALRHPWFKEAPLPVPLSRSEIRQLRRNREEAISSGAHHQALAQQRAAVARQFANEQAAQIAATLKQRIGL
jgi:serine/threonine protein kinase